MLFKADKMELTDVLMLGNKWFNLEIFFCYLTSEQQQAGSKTSMWLNLYLYSNTDCLTPPEEAELGPKGGPDAYIDQFGAGNMRNDE